MQTHVVVGRFLKSDGSPYAGEITFLPEKLWTVENGKAYAALAPRIQLDDGKFRAEVSVGHYIVTCPLGKWRIKISETLEGTSYLSDHLPSRFR